MDFASEKWKNIRTELRKCDDLDINIFYRHFWLSKYCLSTARKLVSNFNKYIPKTITDYTNFVLQLEEASKFYSLITNPQKSDWAQPEELFVFTCLERFDIFNISQIRIFLLALFDIKERKLISFKNLKKILLYLEHYHFIFTAVCSSRPSGLERRYSAYARQLRDCKTKQESADCINNLINDLKESLPDYQTYEAEFSKIIYVSKKENGSIYS